MHVGVAGLYELVGKLPQGRIVAWQTLEMLVFLFSSLFGAPTIRVAD